MATNAELLTEISVRIDDASYRRFSQESLRRFINEGTREIGRRTECMFTVTTVDMDSEVQDYDISNITNLVRIHHVTVQLDGDLQVVPLDYYDLRAMDQLWGQFRKLDFGAWPEYYTTWGTPGIDLTLTLAPTPTQDGTLTVYYYRLPAQIDLGGSDDDDLVDLPSGWEDLVVDFSIARAARQDRDIGDYQVAMQEFGDRLQALNETSIRYNDTPGQMTNDLRWYPGGDMDWMY